MANDTTFLLQSLQESLTKLDSQIVGKIVQENDCISLFEGRMKLKPVIMPNEPGIHPSIAHVHVLAELQSKTHGVVSLEACVMGADADRQTAMRQAVSNWTDFAAPPIFSVIHARPVLDAVHFDGTESWSVPNRHGFMGAINLRTMTIPGKTDKPEVDTEALLNLPVFSKVDELVFDPLPRIVKATLNRDPDGQWRRSLEFDHDFSYSEPDWKPTMDDPQGIVIASRFAVFFKPLSEGQEIVQPKLQILDDVVKEFVRVFESVPPEKYELQNGIDRLIALGIDPDVADRLSQMIVMTFGRVISERTGVELAETYAFVHKDGHFDTDLPIITEPIFQRSAALMPMLMQSESLKETVFYLACMSSDLRLVNQMLHEKKNLKNLALSPPIILAGGVDSEQAQQAIDAILQQHVAQVRSRIKPKRWWEFWK